jgi:dihydroorotate dehydrogenase electron transfer subunit
VNVESAVVLSTEQVYEGGFVTWFDAPALAAGVTPGQFVMVHCSTDRHDPYFARAFSYHRIDGDRFALLYSIVGPGTRWLSERKPGDVVGAYGPLGKGFRLPPERGNLLLVSGGVGVAPMVAMAEAAVRHGHSVVSIIGARTSGGLLSASHWPAEVELVSVTEDGSSGLHGRVTEHLGPYQQWASRIYACGPNAMFQSLAAALRHNGRRQRPEILMEENMPCGWGMCYGCALFTKRGVRLCCKDGPRFNLFDVYE